MKSFRETLLSSDTVWSYTESTGFSSIKIIRADDYLFEIDTWVAVNAGDIDTFNKDNLSKIIVNMNKHIDLYLNIEYQFLAFFTVSTRIRDQEEFKDVFISHNFTRENIIIQKLKNNISVVFLLLGE